MAEFGAEEAELRIKRVMGVNMKKFSRGFRLLDSYSLNCESNIEILRREGTPEEVRRAKERIEKSRYMRNALEKGDPAPLMDYIIETINNNMRFVREYSINELLEENPNRFEMIKDLLETLEQLKRGE